ncbi:hypothetical protein MET9862_02789 [Methylobacterium symbioticum]|uniref:Uncharacterized protein n=1 Tax=Methylobacterium symbioticum TaxID=2584084 RepID=A0A509EF24_9HYPH|nr:hypothetical protein MET9862_02789 [Methylobacterium symbioticum]
MIYIRGRFEPDIHKFLIAQISGKQIVQKISDLESIFSATIGYNERYDFLPAISKYIGVLMETPAEFSPINIH